MRDLFAFSKWLLVNNVIGVGSRAGAFALGMYSVSFEVANLPTREMVRPVMRAVFPGYALMSNDPTRPAQDFVPFFSVVLRWIAATPVLHVLALYGGIRAAQANTGSVYMALDRPQLAAAMTLLNVVLAFGSFAVALGRMGMAEAAWFMVLGALVAAAVTLWGLNRMLGQGWRRVLGALLHPAIAVAVMTAALVPLQARLWSGRSPLVEQAAVLICLILAGAVLYLVTLVVAWNARGRPTDSAEHAVIALVRGIVSGRTA